MKTLGNIIWIVFGGLHIALEYFIAGLILMITLHRRTDTDDNHHRHPLRLAESETGYAGHLAVRYESKMEAITARLSEHFHECPVVLRWRHLDMAHPHLLRSHILYYHHRHPIRKDALPTGKTGSFTFWERNWLNPKRLSRFRNGH